MSATATATATRPVADVIVDEFTKNPDAFLTVAELLPVTHKSRTTVTDNLKKLADSGVIIRLDKDGAVLWALTPTRKAAVKRAAKKAERDERKADNADHTEARRRVAETHDKSVKVTEASARAATAKKGNTVTDADNTPAAETRTPTGRRVKGAIDLEIRAWFEANSNVPAGSYAVARGIDSSSGAAYVALRRMDKEGKAILVSTEPDRYSIDLAADAWNVPTVAE